MNEFEPFAISNFRISLDRAVEPWLLPREAFPVLKNCHVYRGVVEKILGYVDFCVISDRQCMEIPGIIDGVNKNFVGVLTSLPVTNNITVRAIINAAATTSEIFTDDGTGTLTGSNGGSGTVDYDTGDIDVTFGTSAPVSINVAGTEYNAVIVCWDAATDGLPIMGIKPYFQVNGTEEVIIFTTRRAGKVVPLAGTMASNQQLNYGFSEIPHQTQLENVIPVPAFNGAATSFTGTSSTFIAPGTFAIDMWNITGSTPVLYTRITDNGSGLLRDSAGVLNAAGNNYINYATGQWILTFTGAPAAATYQLNYSGCVYGDVFTGTFSNFFSVFNWFVPGIRTSYMFLTNGLNPVRYYDGSCLNFVNTNLSVKANIAPYDISTALHVVVVNERLHLLAPTVRETGLTSYFQYLNTSYWSEIGNPLSFINGGNLSASTSDPIKTYGIINTDLIVRFSRSERVLRYTGDDNSPYRWDKTNVLWRCDAPYSAINYDSWFSAIGQTAITGSDGVNVKKADQIIPDFTYNQRVDETQPILSLSQTSVAQSYGYRSDTFKEGMLCYKAYDADNTGSIQPSDSILSFNYLDDTYSIYTFPMSVLGSGRVTTLETWSSTFTEWDMDFDTWNSYSDSLNAIIELGGDQNGRVYRLGEGSEITDMSGNYIPLLMELITKDFNPYVEQGQLARFGYLDLLVTAYDDTILRVQFYKDNQMDVDFNTFYKESTLYLNGSLNQNKVWKRIYVNAVGKCHTIRFYQQAADVDVTAIDQPVKIHAMVLYMKPAGRIYNG